MKRVISLTLVILLVASLFVGCGGNGVAGTYKLKTINGMDVGEFFNMLVSSLGGDNIDFKADELMVMTLKDDGTVEITSHMDDEAESISGTWKQDGDKVSITAEDETMECTLKDGQLVIEQDGVSMVFAK